MAWLLIFIFIALVFILAMFLTITLSLEISQRNSINETRLMVSLLKGLISFKIEIPKIAIDDIENKPAVKVVSHLETEGGTPIKEIKEKARLRPLIKKIQILIKNYWNILKDLMKATKIKKLVWKTELGLGDPAVTGILVGSIWSIKGITLYLISKYLTIQDKNPKIQVIPRFQQSALLLDINCIFDIRLGHIIIAAIRVLFKFLRLKGVKINE